MWFIKIKSFTRGDTWYFVNDRGLPQMSPFATYAQAFAVTDVEEHRQFLVSMFGRDRVELIECSSRKLLTREMLRVLNLEQVQ